MIANFDCAETESVKCSSQVLHIFLSEICVYTFVISTFLLNTVWGNIFIHVLWIPPGVAIWLEPRCIFMAKQIPAIIDRLPLKRSTRSKRSFIRWHYTSLNKLVFLRNLTRATWIRICSLAFVFQTKKNITLLTLCIGCLCKCEVVWIGTHRITRRNTRNLGLEKWQKSHLNTPYAEAVWWIHGRISFTAYDTFLCIGYIDALPFTLVIYCSCLKGKNKSGGR